MNLLKLEKQYTQLTVEERAKLMISARMRDDDSEVKKLVASAERKGFNIRANDESDICEAWHKAHLLLISLNAESHIKQLKCALTCCKLVFDEDEECEEDTVEQVFNAELFHLQSRKITLLAFMDWIDEHDLPFEKELLEACGIELSLLDSEDRDELRKYDSYSDIYSLFTNVWEHR